MSFLTPTCPTGCDSRAPEFLFDFCNPHITPGEIDRIFMASADAAAFTDVEDLAEWNARLSNDSADPDAIRFWDVQADLPIPERNSVDISRGRKYHSKGKFTINVDIDDVSDENYEGMRTTQCHQVNKFWFQAGTKIFGGNDGFLADCILDYQIDRGTQTLQMIKGQITWENQYSPERHNSPFV